MRIYHNIPALTAYNALNVTNKALSKSIEKLSTGLRINSAADDAAGLAISEKMRAQINGMEVAIRNAEDGVSMIQTAEGALNETHAILQRMRELAVQAANDTLTSEDRGYIQLEIDQLKDQIDRIAKTTQFNKKRLLDGSSAGIWSSDKLATKAYIRGSLREIDQFGQKAAFEGNYKITIKAEPGQGEAQKTDIFKIKHPNVVMNVGLNKGAGAEALRVDNLPAGDYMVKTAADPLNGSVAANATGAYGFNKYWETTLKPADQTGFTPNSTGKIKISLANGGSVEVDIPVDGSGNVTGADILTAIKAAKLDGLDITETGGVIKFTSVKGAVTVTQTGLDDTAVPPLSALGDAAQAKDIDFNNLMDVAVGSAFLQNNASILFEVTAVNTTAGTVTLKATANVLGVDGTVKNYVNDNVVLSEGQFVDLSESLGLGTTAVNSTTPADGTNGAFQMQLKADETIKFTVGNKFVYNVTAKAKNNAQFVEITGTQNQDWTYKWGTSVIDNQDGVIDENDKLQFGLDAEQVKNKEIHFRNFYLNDKNGTVYEGDIVLTTNDTQLTEDKTLVTFEAAYIGQIAKSDVKLRDLDKFWNASGVFMLNDPKTITIYQGDGKHTSVTIYGTDTLGELRAKLNDAIANGLGQAQFAVSNANDFVTFVEGSGRDYGLETVPGTFIIRSLIAGAAGKLSFSGDEDLINAFSLNVVQEAKENSFTASVYDAHSGATIANNVTVSGNLLIGVIHPNVDVEFDPMANIKVEWNDNLRNFVLSAESQPYETILHLVDNSTVFQVGANEGEDLAVDIGDMTAAALGVTRIIVTDRVSAGRSIAILDTAINRVSSQRAKLGAFQNALEYTVTNLTTTSTNLTAAESRIRDADMAKEMMEFVKLQILNQSGTAMLAQANQLPQSVLSLLG